MPAPILHGGAIVLCAHGGRATPTMSSTRVRVAGRPVTTVADHYRVAGCPLARPASIRASQRAGSLRGATRVRVGGAPVLLAASQAVCAPNNTPVTVDATQPRVTADQGG